MASSVFVVLFRCFRCFGLFMPPKTAKITKKHNGHTREFVLIILLKNGDISKYLALKNQRYFIPNAMSCKALKFSTVLV